MTQPAKRCLTGLSAKVTCILGSQWGDEGKGKLVDILAEKYDICGRFNGGANAGHTVVVNGNKYAFHLLPCGILYDTCVNLLGNGVVVHVPTMLDELKQLDRDKISYKNRLLLSDRAHLVVNAELEADASSEAKATKGKVLGTTKRGIGPTYAAKANRYGLRVGDLIYWENFQEKYNHLVAKFEESHGVKVNKSAELAEIKEYRSYLMDNKMIVDGVLLMNKYLREGKRVLVEGANATMLDLDYGTYPYVTSSSTTVGGVCTGAGIPPGKIETTIGIMKAYTTRVGEGPFPTELKDNIGEHLQKVGHEVGATTGRKRRCGWLDLQVVNYSNMINDYTSLNMTKLDVFSGLDELRIGTHYTINGKKIEHMPSTIEELAKAKVEYETLPGWKEDISKAKNFEELPTNAKNYVKRVQELVKIPITWVGVGAPREAIIKLDKGC